MDGWMDDGDGWMDGWMNTQRDGWMDGWNDQQIHDRWLNGTDYRYLNDGITYMSMKCQMSKRIQLNDNYTTTFCT